MAKDQGQTEKDRYEELIKLLIKAEAEGFWGEFVIRFREGKCVLINRNETIKPESISLLL